MWHYHDFCKEAGVEPYPGEARVLGACLSYRANQSQSVSMTEKLHAAVAYEHKLRFLPSPTENASIKLIMRAVRRKFTKPRSPVQPLNLKHLLKLNKYVCEGGSRRNLVDWRTVWRMNMLYYTMSRFWEINDLMTKDLMFLQNPKPSIQIQITQSKTDQNGVGSTKNLYCVTTEPLLCPVALTKKYLSKLASHLQPGTEYEGYLQPRMKSCRKTGKQIPLAKQKSGYSSCLDETKQLLAQLEITGRFGEHSGRRGGATAAASNGGTIEDVQSLGNWKSSKTASQYVEQTQTKLEKVSRLLYPK